MSFADDDTRILRGASLAPHPELAARIGPFVDRDRLLATARELIAVPSPTGDAGAALDRLADILCDDGFRVERPAAGHPAAPAVVVRCASGKPGPVLQFDVHLDVVHLPFVPPAVEGDRLTGSGACDMKGGVAAAVEALRIIRDSDWLKRGGVLLTAHELHEAPWGCGEQLAALIREGCVGHAALIPESFGDCLPIVGRGLAAWTAVVRRPGPSVLEVDRPLEEVSVIDVAAELVARLRQYAGHLSSRTDGDAGGESVFVGQVHAGEMFNQFPQECRLEGTRRWLPGEDASRVEAEFRGLVQRVAERSGATIDVEFRGVREPFRLDSRDRAAQAFVEAYATIIPGRALPCGAKPFCDDGNLLCSLAGIPAITHGPTAGGAHTVHEWVSIDDLVRVARVYAVTALLYCG